MDPNRKDRTGRAVVDEEAVRSMRFRHTYKGATVQQLADEYGLGLDACRKILKWKSWRWVSEVGPGAPAENFSHSASEAEIAASEERVKRLLEEGGLK